MDTLALTYRPRSFDDLVGQRVVQVVLRQSVAKQKIPTALLLHGKHGTGKTTTLRILTAATACDTPPDPCGHCTGCRAVHNGTSPALTEIDAGSHGGVDDIRALHQQLRYDTTGRWRFIGLDEAHGMSTAAFNALLKILEEPPPRTTLVLLTTDPRKIPDTVTSRCMRFPFRPLSLADIAGRLDQICTAEGINADPSLTRCIAERADGALRDAVMELDRITRVGITTLDQYLDLVGDTDPGPALLDAIRTGNPGTAYTALAHALDHTGDPTTIATDLTAVLRDLCILHAADLPTSRGTALDARRRLAATIDVRTTVNALKILWDYTVRIRPGDNRRTAIELAVAALVDLFTPTTPPAAPDRVLSFADMAAMSR